MPEDLPGDLAGREARVRLELQQVWIMNQQCWRATDVMLREAAPSRSAPARSKILLGARREAARQLLNSLAETPLM